MIGSYSGVILPYAAFGMAIAMFILTTYFRQIPGELLEAAGLDGCSEVQLFRHVALPLARPAVTASVIILVLSYWNEFPLTLVAGRSTGMMNLPVALGALTYGRAEGVEWPLLAAAIVVASIPITAVFVALQKQLIGGLGGYSERDPARHRRRSGARRTCSLPTPSLMRSGATFVPDDRLASGLSGEPVELSYRDAINAALHDEMEYHEVIRVADEPGHGAASSAMLAVCPPMDLDLRLQLADAHLAAASCELLPLA